MESNTNGLIKQFFCRVKFIIAPYCVLVLTIASLLQRELHKKGFEISIPKMIENLSAIREVVTFYPKDKVSMSPVKLAISEMTKLQSKLYRLLELNEYCSS